MDWPSACRRQFHLQPASSDEVLETAAPQWDLHLGFGIDGLEFRLEDLGLRLSLHRVLVSRNGRFMLSKYIKFITGGGLISTSVPPNGGGGMV